MACDQRPGAAALTRLDVDGTVRIVLEGITVSNGLAWSPDGFLVYYNDTATHRVDVFDYDRDGGLTGQRTFAAIPDGGRPDGLTVDEQGGVGGPLQPRRRVALHRRGGARRGRGRAGQQGHRVHPRRADLDQLFVTTSRENLEPGSDPLAGSLFRAAVGVRGPPVHEFAG